MTIETFSIAAGWAGEICGRSSSSVIVLAFLLDTALWLGDAADLGGELRRSLREQPVELLDRDSGFLSERANRRSGACREVAVAHEPHDQPVSGGQLGDAVVGRDLLRDPLVPLLRVGQEA